MIHRLFCAGAALLALSARPVGAAPAIDPIPTASIPAGKSLIIPVTATSPSGLPLTFSASSSTNAIGVVIHTNNPFWKFSVVQAATNTAPGAYTTPFRGGTETVTNLGDMTFMLFRDLAPHTVDVFQGLTAGGMYTSNTIFHRVIAGFMNQGGDPMTNGLGGPVFRYDDEFHPQAIFSGVGQLALANSGADTDGSQFFVTIEPYRYGDFTYTIFGQLLRGFNVLTNINNTPVDANSRPLANVIITKASLVPDYFDTVITLTGTNLAGASGLIKVIADDGAGGRTTNSFTAKTVADANTEPPIFFPVTVTNLCGPANKPLTNWVTGYDFAGITNNWYVWLNDANSQAYATNSAGYIVSNQLQIVVVPNSNYVGPISLGFYVSATPAFSAYEQTFYTFAFGDTPIAAQPTNFTARPLAAFTGQPLVTFTNGTPNSSATNFTAFINWGDNSTNNGVITTNSAGRKQVIGSHTYTNPGDYPVYVTLQSWLGASSTVVCTSTVLPTLSFARTATTDVVGWPAWASAFEPVAATNLAAPAWVAITNPPALSGYQLLVTNGSTATNLFLRLRR